MDTSDALLVADLTGVAVFAVSGASAAIAKHLDAFGVVFVGFVAALGGGIFRDVMIDVVPPLAFSDWRYSATAAAASMATFWFHPQIGRLARWVLILDAAGLGLFTAAGTLKALDFGVPVVGAIILGMITGIGGGLLRDLLTAEIPLVLRRGNLYASAAILGTSAYFLLVTVGARRAVATWIGMGIVASVRLASITWGLQLPVFALEGDGVPARRDRTSGPP